MQSIPPSHLPLTDNLRQRDLFWNLKELTIYNAWACMLAVPKYTSAELALHPKSYAGCALMKLNINKPHYIEWCRWQCEQDWMLLVTQQWMSQSLASILQTAQPVASLLWYRQQLVVSFLPLHQRSHPFSCCMWCRTLMFSGHTVFVVERGRSRLNTSL